MAKLWGNVSCQTIHRALKKIGFTRKKKTYGYKERDEKKRAKFKEIIATKDPENLRECHIDCVFHHNTVNMTFPKIAIRN